MKTQNYVTLLFFVTLPFIKFAQTSQVSTQQSEEEKIALLEKASQAVMNGEFQSASDYFVPLTITILHEDDGSGGEISDADVLEVFCEVKESYAPYGINLYIDTIRHVNNSDLFNYGNSESLDLLLGVENAINIYFLASDASGACASALYPTLVYYGYQCFHSLGMTKTFARAFGLISTAGYEVPTGHNCGIQMEVGEKVDGSNCETAGDRICDTPPDYAKFSWECDSNGEGCIQIDPDGVEFRPDGTNFMSVSNCQSQFSPMQAEVMKYTIEATFANSTIPPSSHNLSEITDNPVLLFPEDGAPSVNPLNVTFSWEPVENATHYLIEINRTSSFSSFFMIANAIVTTNQYNSDDLLPSNTYYWRIKPYNVGYCAPYSDTSSFMTSSVVGIEEIDGLERFEVYPNPAVAGKSIGIELQSNKYLEGTLSLHNIHGQTAYSNSITANGTDRFEIKTEDLPTGLYVVNIDFSNAAAIQKKVLVIGQ